MIEHCEVDPLDIDFAFAVTPQAKHLKPIWTAVRDHGLALAIVPQGHSAFQLPEDKPVVLMIGDDMKTARGPHGFHRPSIRRALKRSIGGAIVSCEPIPLPYAAAAAVVGMGRLDPRRNVFTLIETQPDREAEWLAFIRQERPNMQLILAQVRPDEVAS